ncbi:MAG: flagellar protein FlgN [Lachnospiraceae bacterium]|nr:flagellar protein FlgN [Lachnospiraceae bacterium]
MASLMEDLIDVLDKENSEYEILLELSNRKTPTIVAGDIKELEKITDDEQIVVGRINQQEQKRQSLMNDIANVINKDVKTLKLVNLIQMLEKRPQEQKRLATVHDELQETMKNMVNVNNHNRELIEMAKEMVEFDLNIFQAMKAAPETANYNKGAYSSGSVMGNDTTSFDAKQ